MLILPCDGSADTVGALSCALAAAVEGTGETVLPVAAGGGPPGFDTSGPVPTGTAVVVGTSGSTSEPKGVLLSARALRASAEATHTRLGGPGRWLLTLPAHHVAGVQVLVRSLLAGAEAVVHDLRQGFRPERFRSAGCRYTALVPTQIRRLLDAGGPGLAALREFDAVLLGGAGAPEPLLARAREAGVRVVTTYGMTETAGGCVYDGVPLAGVRVRIGPPPEGTAGPAAGGPIALGGPTLASGYLNRPERTARSFEDGWFRTDDLGRWREDGRLQVLGRADDVIVTGGVKVSPSVVERVLREQPGVGDVCVVGVDDPEWGQIVVAAIAPCEPGAVGREAVGALKGAVRDRLGRAAAPKDIRIVRALPLRGVGKPDRQAVRRLFSAE
ncbi:o-succinylbenzoate--CoA ligase [Streptomyces malaysiensis]|uniref:o-succinylbenzoate--CoA ligase n=1 Tax=Streptomyces malaysiensis TaxID=92644 RepID=UPI000C2C7C84|nr:MULTISPECIES: o-succinylbenzoate--CoA ligase [unclassified Streptomyces]AUA08936.1 2-succinylbenzoate--CoA ligase [Streptomyces sp. M56]MYX55291.1 AMP-binding protein [Streptomyces sp. SID8382]